MLRQLAQYAERNPLPPVLYSLATIRYAILLDEEGRLLSTSPVELSDPATPKLKGRKLLVPQVQKTSGVRANLLNGNAEYTLAVGREGSKPERVTACHQAYIALLRQCAEQTREPSVHAVLAFLEHDPTGQLQLGDDFAPDAGIVFQVDGIDPTEHPTVQAFWAAINDPSTTDAPTMQCLVCSNQRPVLRVLPQKIKGLRDGQPTGTSLISANSEAFESYGLKNSLIAPICGECAERFTNGINDLLANRESCIRLGGAEFIFWTRDDIGFSLRDSLDDPSPAFVQALLESVRSGKRQPEIDDSAFYAAVLSGSVARAVVREWIDQTVGEAKVALARWFEDQAVVDRDGGEIRPLGLYPLAAATVRDASKELAPPTIRSLLRAALTNTPAPADLLARAIRRNRADGAVTHPRAALIKLVLARQGMSREEVRQMAQLNPDHPSPAYQLGRLLAVLDIIQYEALGSVNATVVDRYFGTASSAPVSVFPYLIRGSIPHLAKLRKNKGGAYWALQQRLEQVLDKLPAERFSSVLTLPDQGLFSLGFYHERAEDRRRRNERRRGSANGSPDATTDVSDDSTDEEKSS